MISESTNYLRLRQNLEYLQLKQMALSLSEVLKEGAECHHSTIEMMLRLTDQEVERKKHNRAETALKVANFPHRKTLADFDFSFQPKINEKQIRNLHELGFIEQKENIVFLGNSGVGKTHLAVSLGMAAARNRISTYFIKCHNLIDALRKAKTEHRLMAKLRHLKKYRLLIIDELGYLPLEKGDADLLFQLIDLRYESKSTIITTNANFDEWPELLKDEQVAAAIIDRILHHCTVIGISGKSYRLKTYFPDKDESVHS